MIRDSCVNANRFFDLSQDIAATSSISITTDIMANEANVVVDPEINRIIIRIIWLKVKTMCLSFWIIQMDKWTGKCLGPSIHSTFARCTYFTYLGAARSTDDPIRAQSCHTRFISIYFHMHIASRETTMGEQKNNISVDIFAVAAAGYVRRTRVDAFVSNIQFSLSPTQIGCIFRCRSGCMSP